MSQVSTAGGIDLSDVAFWAKPIEERHEAFALLRREDPIPFYAEPEMPPEAAGFAVPGKGYYSLIRHADVLEASRQPQLFASGQGATSIADMAPEGLEFFGSMINMDDPRHKRLRGIVSAGFTPRRMQQTEETVRRVAKEIVDELLERGSCDFVTDVAAALPLRIICDMMGIPDSQYRFVFDQSNVILGAGDPEYTPEGTDLVTALLTAGANLSQLMVDLAEHRKDNPADDLTSAMVHAELDGERLTHQELASFFILLAVAGNETTRNALSWALHLLTEHPDQRALLQADLPGVLPTAVEEIVRWASPVIFMRRTVTTDGASLGGRTFDAGDKLILFYWAANRDEAVFTDPGRFDVRRSPNDHVGFGGPGPHFCLGAHLARREITVMLEELLTRTPGVHATGQPDRLLSPFINGVKHLPCDITPAG